MRKYILATLHLSLATCAINPADNGIKSRVAAQNLALIQGISDHFLQCIPDKDAIKIICDYIRITSNEDFLLIPCFARSPLEILPNSIFVFLLSDQNKLQMIRALEKPANTFLTSPSPSPSEQDCKKLASLLKQMDRNDNFTFTAEEIPGEVSYANWLHKDCFFENAYTFLKLHAHPTRDNSTLYHLSQAHVS